MPKEQNVRHELTDDEHGGTCSSSTANTQAAAAWSWFQHGGGTTSKPEGERLPQRQQTGLKSSIVRPSRFKIEAENRMVSSSDHDSGCRPPPPDEANVESGTRRRHSFHQELLRPTLITSRFPSIDHEIKRCSCSSDCEASSLFDSFELEALSKQLEQTLTGRRTAPIPATIWEGRDLAEPSLPAKVKFPMDNHRADSDKVAGKRNHSGFRHKHEKHHHHHHALLHQFFHFRIPAPFCNSISIANSSVNTHVHPEGAPKKPRNKQSHDASRQQYSQKYSKEDIHRDCNLIKHPDDEHNSHKKVHKLQPHIHATHFADFYSKLLQPLIHLPLRLRHADGNSESRTNHHHFHHHKHFHHHHHHHYHHLNRLHHHDAHRLDAAGLKLEQDIFYPQQRRVEYRPPIVDDDHSSLVAPRIVHKSQAFLANMSPLGGGGCFPPASICGCVTYFTFSFINSGSYVISFLSFCNASKSTRYCLLSFLNML